MRRAKVAVALVLLAGCEGQLSGGLPDPADAAVDVAEDTARPDVSLDGSGKCTTDAHCKDDPRGSVCDVATGTCLPCTPAKDACKPDHHCVGTTCVSGCKSDDGCVSVVDAGGRTRCDVARHVCVDCLVDAHCGPGQRCVGNACARGCSPASPCPGSETCCAGACVDAKSNVDHCGECGKKCTASGGVASCAGGLCGIGSCKAPLEDCDFDPGNGCETNLSTSPDHCGACGKKCASCSEGVCTPFATCAAIKAASPSAPSGRYTIDPDGGGPVAPFDVFCEMTADGGGWTLAMKLDGKKATFGYDATYWTTTALLAPTSADMSANEAKLESFNSVKVTALRLGMTDAGVTRYIVHTVPATNPKYNKTLREIFAGATTPTTIGRAAWRSLVASPSLQPNCNREGTNVDLRPFSNVRLGIVGNNEANCLSPDSFIGFGAGPVSCLASGILVTTGNVASCGSDAGDRSVATFGYVFVR